MFFHGTISVAHIKKTIHPFSFMGNYSATISHIKRTKNNKKKPNTKSALQCLLANVNLLQYYSMDATIMIIVTRCMVTVFFPVLIFSWCWSKLPFWSATDVMSNYLNPLTEIVFLSVCCVVTHLVMCTLCIVVGNRRRCSLYVFISCVLQKEVSSSLVKISRSFMFRCVHLSGPVFV